MALYVCVCDPYTVRASSCFRLFTRLVHTDVRTRTVSRTPQSHYEIRVRFICLLLPVPSGDLSKHTETVGVTLQFTWLQGLPLDLSPVSCLPVKASPRVQV